MLHDRAASNPYEFSYTMRRKLQKKITKFLIFTIVLSITTLLFLNFVLFSVSIKSDSMNPALEAEDQIFVSPLLTPLNPLFTGKNIITRGDIVLLSPQTKQNLSLFKKAINVIIGFVSFRKAAPFTPLNEMTSQTLLRRVIGLPGDTLYLSDYTVYIKPKDSQYFLTEFELSGKMYDINNSIEDNTSSFDQSLGAVGSLKEFTLKDKEYFVLSDNRISGLDSRIWGSVHEKEIIAKAVVRYFPFKRINML